MSNSEMYMYYFVMFYVFLSIFIVFIFHYVTVCVWHAD